MKSVKMYIAVILSILIVWYIAFGLILFFRQSSYVYMPSNQVEFSPADVNLAFEDIHVETSDGETISAWYIPADDKEMCVLFFHGQGGNISHRLETIKIINSLGLNCMIFDYRGYGKSSGIPTEAGTYLDGNAVYNWLRENKILMKMI